MRYSRHQTMIAIGCFQDGLGVFGGIRLLAQTADRNIDSESMLTMPFSKILSRASVFSAAATLLLLTNQTAQPAVHSRFVLTSSDPQLAISVPLIYTAKAFGCTGGNSSPPLHWSGAPAGTKSFVVTLFDPDERSTPSGWWHWAVYDLPGDTHELAQGAGTEHSKSLPAGALQGRTDLGEDAYHGPCPAKGDPPHHYTFTIYALSVEKLDVPPDSSGAMITSTAQDHLLGKAVFVAHYGR